MAEQKTLVELEMVFEGGLRSSGDGLSVIKRRNQIAKQKEGMERLLYDHQRMGERADTSELI